MMDAGEEIGVVPDLGGQIQDAVCRMMQQMRPLVRTLLQQRADRVAQRLARAFAECQEAVQRGPDAEIAGGLGLVVEQLGFVQRAQVEDLVADRDAAAGRAGERAEHAEGQVLDREIRVAVGRGDPALQ